VRSRDNAGPTPEQRLNTPPIHTHLVFAGLQILPEAFDSRPVIVIDNEGLFYRPNGASLISWRDIRTVERDRRSDHNGFPSESGSACHLACGPFPTGSRT
jgi:hypothetical protein